jgi:hypothetical protein
MTVPTSRPARPATTINRNIGGHSRDIVGPLSGAERNRLYRRRSAGRVWVCSVEIDFDTIEFLIDQGLLDEQASQDRKHIATAVGKALQKYRDASRRKGRDAA